MGIALRGGLAAIVLCGLSACGGGGGGGTPNPGNNPPPTGGTFTAGVFAPRADFAAQCIAPRAGTNDRTGSAFTEKMFLRSWTNELYLWYNEVADDDPNLTADVIEYFETKLKTHQVTPSGNDKDRFHFDIDTATWIALSQSGQSIGYGAEFILLDGDGLVPRHNAVAYVEPGTPAANAGVQRGMEILTINGVDFVNDNTQAGVNVIAEAFQPSAVNETFTFVFGLPGGGTSAQIQLTSANITHKPVLVTDTIDQAGKKVGYLLFNDHIATSEAQLIDAVTALKADGIQDLVLDIRYNGGGFLDIANELAFMSCSALLTDSSACESCSRCRSSRSRACALELPPREACESPDCCCCRFSSASRRRKSSASRRSCSCFQRCSGVRRSC